MPKKDDMTLKDALDKIARCYDMQSNDKNECFQHGLNPETCKACVHFVTPGTAWMMLAALSKTSIAPR